MYETRICAFVDLLGFRSLVESSANNPSVTESILFALESLQPSAIADEMYARINHENVPPEELDAVQESVRMMSAALAKEAEVRVSYFSDCIFMSADADNILASQLLLDRLAELSVTMWTQHRLLLRGGITMGELIHVQGGPVFGPALVCAYFMESKNAVHPRIIVDSACIDHLRKAETFGILESMFESDEDFDYMSLATALRFHINDSALVLGPPVRLLEHVRTFKDASSILGSMLATIERDDVKEKYRWLMGDFDRRAKEVTERPYLEALAQQ